MTSEVALAPVAFSGADADSSSGTGWVDFGAAEHTPQPLQEYAAPQGYGAPPVATQGYGGGYGAAAGGAGPVSGGGWGMPLC